MFFDKCPLTETLWWVTLHLKGVNFMTLANYVHISAADDSSNVCWLWWYFCWLVHVLWVCEKKTALFWFILLWPTFYLSDDMYIVYIVQCSMHLHLDKIRLFFNKLIIAALCNRGAIIFLPCSFFYLSVNLSIFFFSSPNLSGRRLDVYHDHTLTHGVALVRI